MEPISQDEREIRAARNQAMFRAVNDKIRELNETFAVITDTFTIACECADPYCVDTIEIKHSDYEAIRANPRRFAVLPGHADTDIEYVVTEAECYQVAEKRGKAAAVADAFAPQGDDGS
jgi:hypothetical protein